MKIERKFARAVVTDKGARWLGTGHPWLYDSDVASTEGDCRNGCLIDVVNAKDGYIGTGFLSLESKIRVRLVSRNANDKFDRDFWRRRIEYAWSYRLRVMGDDASACRVIFGEADGFPGLTVDRFGDILVTEVASYGMEMIKDTVYPLLCEVMNASGAQISGIYERNDVPVRELEGLPQQTGFLRGEFPTTVEMEENGIKFLVDVAHGQKTGFFLDQKENRVSLAPLVRGREVLDCFTHTGSFALHAAKYGASHVTGVDISEDACAIARRNAELNGLNNVEFVAENAFDLLRRSYDEKKHYDVIILDPPAFTKTRQALSGALRGYKEINLRAMKMLPKGGYLVTCSCSQHVSPEAFTDMLLDAARDAHRQLRLIESRTQGKDHPILLAAPETRYLKFMVFQVF